jgi:hypothetical protein
MFYIGCTYVYMLEGWCSYTWRGSKEEQTSGSVRTKDEPASSVRTDQFGQVPTVSSDMFGPA